MCITLNVQRTCGKVLSVVSEGRRGLEASVWSSWQTWAESLTMTGRMTSSPAWRRNRSS